MDPDLLKETESLQQEEKVPRRINWEIKDLVHPIVLRRRLLWRAGLALGMLAGIALVVWALFLRPPTGPALLDDMVRVAGGQDAWNTITDGSFRRIHTRYDDNGAVIYTDDVRFYFRKGDGGFKMVIESISDLGRVLIGFDDQGYWATKDGDTVGPLAVARRLDMACEADKCTPLCGAEMAFYRFSMPFKLTDPGVIPRFGGHSTLNGKAMLLLDVTFEPEVGKDRWVAYVDEETRLIRKIEHYPSADGDAPPEEIYWSDYQTENGITFSHTRSYYRSNGSKLEEYVISDVDLSTPIPDERLVRPESRPVQNVSMQP